MALKCASTATAGKSSAYSLGIVLSFLFSFYWVCTENTTSNATGVTSQGRKVFQVSHFERVYGLKSMCMSMLKSMCRKIRTIYVPCVDENLQVKLKLTDKGRKLKVHVY